MDGSGRRTGAWALRTRAVRMGVAIVAVLSWAEGRPAAAVESEVANARLKHPRERMAVAVAIRGAAGRLAEPACQGLLDEFSSASGEPLRAALNAEAVSVREYLDRVLFYDAPQAACQESTLAFTAEVGSRVIRVCGGRFTRAMAENARHAESVVIHEMLHSLGLGENPPTSHYITSRILARCRQ